MRIGILLANADDSPFAQSHPSDDERWIALLGPKKPDWKFDVFAVADGKFPKSIKKYDGWILTGGQASVHDDAPWIAKLSEFIRMLVDKKAPLFAACFGHQAVAAALGATVAPNPNGPVLGSVEVEGTSPAPWMVVRRTWLYATHGEHVTQAPTGATTLFKSEDCPIAGFSIGDHVFTTQYHPEMMHRFFADLVEDQATKQPPELVKAARDSLPFSADNGMFSDWIIQFFELKRS